MEELGSYPLRQLRIRLNLSDVRSLLRVSSIPLSLFLDLLSWFSKLYVRRPHDLSLSHLLPTDSVLTGPDRI